MKIATVGTGFFCPPDETPLRFMREGVPEEAVAEVRRREQWLLENMNRVVADGTLTPALSQRERGYERVAELYHNEQTTHFLLTFPELDHFANRGGNPKYWGALPFGLGGESFVRPPGRDPCLFGYLKPFKALPSLLEKLSKAKINSKVYVDGLADDEIAPYRSERLQFAQGPIDG